MWPRSALVHNDLLSLYRLVQKPLLKLLSTPEPGSSVTILHTTVLHYRFLPDRFVDLQFIATHPWRFRFYYHRLKKAAGEMRTFWIPSGCLLCIDHPKVHSIVSTCRGSPSVSSFLWLPTQCLPWMLTSAAFTHSQLASYAATMILTGIKLYFHI